jgi:hypothetical protein
MNTHTHTPGPWRIDSKTRFGDYTIAAGESVKTCEFIAKTQSDTNARLIAAAPDLLAALREIESKLTALLCERVLDSTLPEFYEVRDARNSARAAIAKAEGVK